MPCCAKTCATSPVFLVSDFLGGMPSAIFLFLTGATLAFLMDSRERKGALPGERVWASLRRAGFILSLAIAQRMQNWLSGGPGNGWNELLRVDILNAMGLALLVMAPLAVVGTIHRVRLAAAAGLLIAVASPLVSQLDMSRLPSAVRGYLAPDYAAFGFFPWAAFLAFGVSAGSLIRLLDAAQMERAMRWAAAGGCALLIGSRYLSAIPYSIYSEIGILAEQPVDDFRQIGRNSADDGFCIRMDKLPREPLELGAATGHDIAAGVLGAPDGVRPLARSLAGQSGSGAIGAGRCCVNRGHGCTVGGPHSLPQALRLAMRVAVAAASGAGFRRLTPLPSVAARYVTSADRAKGSNATSFWVVRTIMCSAVSTSSSLVNLTVTRNLTRSLPSTLVAGVMAKVRVSELLPSTVRFTVILLSARVVMVPEKKSPRASSADGGSCP